MADMRSPSSSASITSSLTGAMGETNISHSRHSRSPPSRPDNTYTANDWNATSHMHPHQPPLPMPNSLYPGVPGMSNLAFQNMVSPDLSAHNVQYHDYNNPTTANRHSSPDSMSSSSSAFCPPPFDQYSLQPPAPHHVQPSSRKYEDELDFLRRRTRELESECNSLKSRVSQDPSRRSSLRSGLPTPPHSSSFEASWKARTDARKRLLCSLNRAGNALCAWHDSRRERRAYPPRNAPPGMLNCGCSHEEALFEESLSRHQVGSYLPGESVRMDPALRNPLLKLLQKRYGYQDGDFDRDPITGDWLPDQGAAYWEQQAHTGASTRRRTDTGH